MATVGFVTHVARDDAVMLEKEATRWLNERGHDGRPLLGPGPDYAPVEADLIQGLDLAVSLGGDGTMLRTVDLVSETDVPVLGVNVGHLGYLTEVEPDDLYVYLERWLDGDFGIERRTTIDVTMERITGALVSRSALNDVVLRSTRGAHAVQAGMDLSGEPFLTYVADALIVATPTGSTAYNLSARGPIASPDIPALIVTPVAPHLLFDRSLVLSPDAEIRLSITDDEPADVIIDGQRWATLKPGATLRVTGGARDARIVSFGERHFHRTLKQKFNLADR